MTKDARLSVRITPELDSWLEAEASSRGLDKAAFARMVLFERMNGIVEALVKGSAVTAETEAMASRLYLDQIEHFHEPYGAGRPVEPPETSTEQTDIEALVNQRVAEALARQPRAYNEGETGMQAHRRGGLPEYGGVANGGIPFRHQRHAVYGA